MRTRIIDGRVIDPANVIDDMFDIFIEDGKIIAVGKELMLHGTETLP